MFHCNVRQMAARLYTRDTWVGSANEAARGTNYGINKFSSSVSECHVHELGSAHMRLNQMGWLDCSGGIKCSCEQFHKHRCTEVLFVAATSTCSQTALEPGFAVVRAPDSVNKRLSDSLRAHMDTARFRARLLYSTQCYVSHDALH